MMPEAKDAIELEIFYRMVGLLNHGVEIFFSNIVSLLFDCDVGISG
jgi:hypothetical protein